MERGAPSLMKMVGDASGMGGQAGQAEGWWEQNCGNQSREAF